MCLYPRLVKNKKYKPNKKNGGIVPAVKDNRVLATPIGCGECIECRNKLRREWQVRLSEDIRVNKNAIYVTLTFNNKSITEIYKKCTNKYGYKKDNEAAKIAVRLFNERHRKKYGKALRHWLVTELGHEGTENIHLHGIIWTNIKTKEITKLWSYGFTKYGTYVNERTINYIVKYIKKIDIQHKYYKPKILTSAGIGGTYIERGQYQKNKYKENGETIETYKTRTGIEIALPIYLRNKIYTEEEREKLWIEKLNKEERYILGQKISIKNGEEAYKKRLKEAQHKNTRLGYGCGKIDWDEKRYEEQRRHMLQKQRNPTLNSGLPHFVQVETNGEAATPAFRGIAPSQEWEK